MNEITMHQIKQKTFIQLSCQILDQVHREVNTQIFKQIISQMMDNSNQQVGDLLEWTSPYTNTNHYINTAHQYAMYQPCYRIQIDNQIKEHIDIRIQMREEIQ